MIPQLIAHCDWSTARTKRWLCVARLHQREYEVTGPMPVGQIDSLFSELRKQAPVGPILAGFDFPIGIPRLYAERAHISRFPVALLRFGEGTWAQFYHPAEEPRQISLTRPFYPSKPGGTSKRQLVDGLGLSSARELLRRCDFATPSRRKACEIFWTLGSSQVGRAAITGWRDLVAPALRKGKVVLWPFDGELSDLLEVDRIVVAESYPAEIYSHIGLSRGFGKRSQEGRTRQAGAILRWCESNGVIVGSALVSAIQDGFGKTELAEDIFDSLVGLLGMIEVVRDPARFVAPDDPYVREIEGWILGMSTDSISAAVPKLAPEAIRSCDPRRIADRKRIADVPSVNPEPGHAQARICPACQKKLFARWPWGWDAHAAYNCSGIEGGTPEARKQTYKRCYLS